jgi:methyltransferase
MEESDLLDYNKASHSSDTACAMRLFHRLGIKVRANFIVRPDFTEDDFARLSETVRCLEVDLPTFAVLTPLPGTLLFEQRRSDLAWNNPDLYDCYHTLFPTRLPLDRFYDRVASLLEVASGRGRTVGSSSPGVFYYSNDHAFERMVADIRDGHRLHERGWQGQAGYPPERRPLCPQPNQFSLLLLR